MSAFAEHRRQNLADQAWNYSRMMAENEAMRERMEGDHLATPGEAHAEWHLNAGVPMGQPGCPQDACHLPDFDSDEEAEAYFSTNVQSFIPELPVGTGVKCGNKKGHASEAPAYHATPADVRQCYALNGSAAKPAPAPAPARVAKPDRVSVEEMQSWKAIPVTNHDHAFYALRSKADGTVTCFRVKRPSTGKYKGKTYVDRQSGDNFVGMPFRETAAVLNAIVKNPAAAAVLYGKTVKRCGLCHRSLTDEKNRGSDGLTSTERGIGPKCAKKVGML